MKEFREMSNVKQKKVVHELAKVLKDLGFENFIVAISTDHKEGEAQETAVCGDPFALAHLMITLQDKVPEEVKAHMMQHALGNMVERILEKESEDEAE